MKRENLDRKVILHRRKKTLKAGSLTRSELRSLVLYLKNGADCPCQQLNELGSHFLVMGRRVEQQYLLTGIHRWDKSSHEFRKAIKKVKSYKCPTFQNVF